MRQLKQVINLDECPIYIDEDSFWTYADSLYDEEDYLYTDDDYLQEIDVYSPCDDRVWKSNIEDIEGGDNFVDFCAEFFKMLEEEGYWD